MSAPTLFFDKFETIIDEKVEVSQKFLKEI